MKQKTERKENAAVMYKNQTKNGEMMFNLTIKASELPEADESGSIKLTGFLNSYKTDAKHPDVLFYPRKEQQARPQRPAPKQKSGPSSNDGSGGNDWF